MNVNCREHQGVIIVQSDPLRKLQHLFFLPPRSMWGGGGSFSLLFTQTSSLHPFTHSEGFVKGERELRSEQPGWFIREVWKGRYLYRCGTSAFCTWAAILSIVNGRAPWRRELVLKKQLTVRCVHIFHSAWHCVHVNPLLKCVPCWYLMISSTIFSAWWK